MYSSIFALESTRDHPKVFVSQRFQRPSPRRSVAQLRPELNFLPLWAASNCSQWMWRLLRADLDCQMAKIP
jgi:hypothetical protein